MYSPWNSPGQNTGVGSLFLLQGIFLTQGSNPGLPLHRQILYQLSHQGNPIILKWVAYPFSSRSFWPRNWTRVSCIAGGFFTSWATMNWVPIIFQTKFKGSTMTYTLFVVKSLSCVQLFCDPMNCSPPDPSVHGISQQECWSELPILLQTYPLWSYGYLYDLFPNILFLILSSLARVVFLLSENTKSMLPPWGIYICFFLILDSFLHTHVFSCVSPYIWISNVPPWGGFPNSPI